MRMKALKTFSPAGGAVVQRGQSFDTNDARARHYELHGMAIFIGDAPPVAAAPEPTEANPAAAAGPSGSAGGRTGAGKPLSSSHLAQAQKPHRSTRRGAARE